MVNVSNALNAINRESFVDNTKILWLSTCINNCYLSLADLYTQSDWSKKSEEEATQDDPNIGTRKTPLLACKKWNGGKRTSVSTQVTLTDDLNGIDIVESLKK